MKKCVITLFLFTFLTHSVFAENAPLRVAIASFSPPFVMRSGQDKYYGFDIATIEYICQTLNRSCEYLPMKSDQLIPTLQAQEADIAIGGLVITLPHARLVRFSTPYMVSKAQFITTTQAPFTAPFQITQLSGKRIGVLNGSAFEEAVYNMRLPQPRIIAFERDSDMIAALHANTLDIALFSLLKANYWQAHSNSILKDIGRPFPVGLGFAIAIDPRNQLLVHEINTAVIQYQESSDYKRNYQLYFPETF